MKKKDIFCAVVGAAFTSCLLFSCSSRDDISENSNNGLSSVEQFLSSNNNQTVDFDINYDVVNDNMVSFKVYSENPYKVNEDGTVTKLNIVPVMSGMTDANGKYKFTRMLPGGVKEVFVTSDCLGVPALLHGVIKDGYVNPERYDIDININNSESRAQAFDYLTLGEWNILGKPDYIDNNVTYDIDDSELKSISNALPESEKISDKYSLANDLLISKDAEIWLSVISDKSLFNNAIGYYCYDKEKGKSEAKEIIAFPSTRTYNSLDGLKKGEYIKLKYRNQYTGAMSYVFPKGTCVSFVLRNNAFNSISGQVNAGIRQYSTNAVLNSESNANIHSSILRTSKDNVIVGFEDLSNEGMFAGDNDCNDVIMHVRTMPSDAIENTISLATNDEKEIVVEDNSEAVRPLTNIIESAAYDEDLKDLVIYTKSKFKITDGKVVGVRDEVYVGSLYNINKLLFDNYGNILNSLPSNVFVYDDFLSSISRMPKKRAVHTTVKEMGIVAEEESRSGSTYSNDNTPAEILRELILQHKDALKNGSYLKLSMYVEFEPVSYLEFITTIPLPPYTPFIVNE